MEKSLVVSSIRRATIALELVPVLCGSSFKNKGVQQLLDAIVAYLPSPVDVPPVEGYRVKGKAVTDEIVERAATDDSHWQHSRSKLRPDNSVGQLSYLRIYSGKVETVLGKPFTTRRRASESTCGSSAAPDARKSA